MTDSLLRGSDLYFEQDFDDLDWMLYRLLGLMLAMHGQRDMC